ncbi:hypothetical protein GOODEAATRI_017997 [Goodea atripinnis]|uniref:Uncharacterized protein n=1 Tax=Goodea atripinnis TaxID=208336 RepID=A0ABV0PYX8_9TELE
MLLLVCGGMEGVCQEKGESVTMAEVAKVAKEVYRCKLPGVDKICAKILMALNTVEPLWLMDKKLMMGHKSHAFPMLTHTKQRLIFSLTSSLENDNYERGTLCFNVDFALILLTDAVLHPLLPHLMSHPARVRPDSVAPILIMNGVLYVGPEYVRWT